MNETHFTRNLAAAILALTPITLSAHPGHSHDAEAAENKQATVVASQWGSLLYRHAEEYRLPNDTKLQDYLVKNHGGSVADPKTNTLYTTIGAKVIRFAPDGSSGILDDTETFGSGNFHGLALVKGGTQPSFYFADNVRHRLRYHSYAESKGHDLTPRKSLHPYFAEGGAFNPTDVELHPETKNPWAFDGYGSNLVFDALSGESAHGGKEVFKTSHGGSAFKGKWVVCSRGSGEICTLTQSGEVTDRVQLPQGSMPCDIDFIGEYALIGCLRGPGAKDATYPGAPCYIYHWPSKQLISTIVPKSDFGFENGTHIHNAAWWPHIEDGKVTRLFIAFSFWNPGDFKVVELKGLPLDWLTPPTLAQK